jgi:hypothetical protein
VLDDMPTSLSPPLPDTGSEMGMAEKRAFRPVTPCFAEPDMGKLRERLQLGPPYGTIPNFRRNRVPACAMVWAAESERIGERKL